MSKVKSREYKFMLDHRIFTNPKESIRMFWNDVKRIAERCGVETQGKFDKDKIDKRLIRFLDTTDYTLCRNRLLLRHRHEFDKPHGEYTLKARIEDRYLADGIDLQPGKGMEGKKKFEEDVAAPFRSRFSQSMTIKDTDIERPTSVSQAGRLFPILKTLGRDGMVCDGTTPIHMVNGFVIHERVLKGPSFLLGRKCAATIALILWASSWKGRIEAAEFSFRYENDQEEYSMKVVEAAFELFHALQSLDWCLADGKTKTQFVYGGQ